MKNAKLTLADIYTGKPLSVSEAFYKPTLELIQQFYEEKALYISKDPEKSPMMIGGAFTYSAKQWGAKDTIIVSRGPIRAGLHPGPKRLERINYPTGARTYNDMAAGSTLIRVVSLRNVQRIGDEVFDLLWLLHNEVAKTGAFQFSDLTMAPEAKVEGGAIEDLMMVTISFNVQLERRWEVTPDGPLLEGVNYDIQ